MAVKKTNVSPKSAAVIHLFEGDSADDCVAIRKDVDAVLAGMSNNAISATTSNDALVSLYIIPDKIQFLYVLLNQALSRYSTFKEFQSGDIKATATVGDIRDAAYSHCNVKCSHT